MIRSLALGSTHSCAISISSGILHCWGDDTFGQSAVPVNLKKNNGSAQVDTGAVHSCAVDQRGFAVCWGLDSFGQVDVPDLYNNCKEVGKEIEMEKGKGKSRNECKGVKINNNEETDNINKYIRKKPIKENLIKSLFVKKVNKVTENFKNL